MAAIFLASPKPPTWQRSGWAMSIARARNSSSNSRRSTSRSPVAIGTLVLALIATSPNVSPGGSGSSTNSGRNGASASMYCSAAEAEPQRPWKSTMISTSSPTASRIAPMQRATLSIWRGLAV